MSSPAGVDNALRMREMFIKNKIQCRLNIEQGFGTVATLWITDSNQAFRAYYFREDGTYYRGAN